MTLPTAASRNRRSMYAGMITDTCGDPAAAFTAEQPRVSVTTSVVGRPEKNRSGGNRKLKLCHGVRHNPTLLGGERSLRRHRIAHLVALGLQPGLDASREIE